MVADQCVLVFVLDIVVLITTQRIWIVLRVHSLAAYMYIVHSILREYKLLHLYCRVMNGFECVHGQVRASLSPVATPTSSHYPMVMTKRLTLTLYSHS